MDLGCDEMGEEQDKFALAVMIFKLLNNGIHPFSGVPRKNDGEMLTIQNRIEEYHYAYGLWPDSYRRRILTAFTNILSRKRWNCLSGHLSKGWSVRAPRNGRNICGR